MNVFTDVLFLFVYLIILFYFKVPDITNTNYLLHKLVIFISLLVFYYILEIIKKIKGKCKIDQKKIMGEALNNSLYGVIGYSIYVDLMYMNFSKISGFTLKNDNERFAAASLVVSLFTLLIKGGKLVFDSAPVEC
jgi:hypothetical protein